jgi:adenine-specific DNA methylase
MTINFNSASDKEGSPDYKQAGCRDSSGQLVPAVRLREETCCRLQSLLDQNELYISVLVIARKKLGIVMRWTAHLIRSRNEKRCQAARDFHRGGLAPSKVMTFATDGGQ